MVKADTQGTAPLMLGRQWQRCAGRQRAIAIYALREMQAPSEYEPLLKTFFTVSYVVLAAFVGAFADSMPKWRVMFISNGIKISAAA
jgi:hypothetical protein